MKATPAPPYGFVAPADNISGIYQFNTTAYPFTIAGWCKFDTKAGSWPDFTIQTIVSCGLAAAYEFPASGWLLGRRESNSKLFFVSDNGAPIYGSEIPNGEWVHVAVTFEAGSGAARKIYLNGVLDIETTGDQPDLAESNQPFLYFTGCNGGFALDYYGGLVNGGLNGWNAWTAVLTPEEIVAEYESLSFAPARLGDWWGCYPFADATAPGIGETAISSYDYSPNCNDLTQAFGLQVVDGGEESFLSSFWPISGPTANTECEDYGEVPNQLGETCPDEWTIPTPSAFPLPGVGPGDSPLYVRFNELAPAWGEFGHAFPDRKPVHNTIQSANTRFFQIEYAGLSEAQAAVLDDHWDSTRGVLSFSLTHPRTAEVLTGVRYETYERDAHEKKWSQRRRVLLKKTPFA